MAVSGESTAYLEPDECLWDVVEEHFEEAFFALWRLDAALSSPLHTLAELPRFEERLTAHVDGLTLTGRLGRERILLREIAEARGADAARVTVAGLALLSARDFDALWPALRHADARVRAAAVRAYQLADDNGLDAWLVVKRNEETEPPALTSLIEACALRGLPPPPRMKALESHDPALRAAAARAALFCERALYKTVLEQLMEDDDPSVRRAAIVTSLAWGTPSALGKLEREVESEACDRVLFALFAALSPRDQHAALLGALVRGETRLACLYALGFSGDAQHIPRLLEHAASADLREAKLAAQSLSMITGVDLREQAFARRPAKGPRTGAATGEAEQALPALEEDDLDANLVPIPEEALPAPDAEALGVWLRRERGRFSAPVRFLFGAPYGESSLLLALERAPLGLRHDLALAGAARSAGAYRLDTRTSSSRQRTQLEKLRALPLPSFLAW